MSTLGLGAVLQLIVPVAPEAEPKRSPEPRSSGPMWAMRNILFLKEGKRKDRQTTATKINK